MKDRKRITIDKLSNEIGVYLNMMKGSDRIELQDFVSALSKCLDFENNMIQKVSMDLMNDFQTELRCLDANDDMEIHNNWGIEITIIESLLNSIDDIWRVLK